MYVSELGFSMYTATRIIITLDGQITNETLLEAYVAETISKRCKKGTVYITFLGHPVFLRGRSVTIMVWIWLKTSAFQELEVISAGQPVQHQQSDLSEW